MKTTMDAAGRVVIPKALRRALGLGDGGEIEVSERDGVIEVRPAPVRVALEDGPSGPTLVPEQPVPALTVEQVRAILERTRR